MSLIPCAAANCDCENFLVPKSGNPKKCADPDYGHPLGAHHASTVTTQRIGKVESKSKQGNHIITLDEEEDSDIQVLVFQKMPALYQPSRIPPDAMVVSTNTRQAIKPESGISFNSKVNLARQKLAQKAYKRFSLYLKAVIHLERFPLL